VYARLQAVISTCRKQGRNVFAMLRDLFARQPVCLLAGG
jgi:sulfur transfer complex TusBCD TusB component (DsrH family)